MRGRTTAVVAAVLAAAALASGVHAATPSAPISLSVDRTSVSTELGRTLTFDSTIRNAGSRPAAGLIGHLNVLSLRTGVYVDPEDWSSQRTRYLAPIPPAGSRTITWKVQAVNSGSFGVYIAVLPRSGAARPPVTGPTIHVLVKERKTLNSGGILPLALGVPAVLALLVVVVRLRRGRGSTALMKATHRPAEEES